MVWSFANFNDIFIIIFLDNIDVAIVFDDVIYSLRNTCLFFNAIRKLLKGVKTYSRMKSTVQLKDLGFQQWLQVLRSHPFAVLN